MEKARFNLLLNKYLSQHINEGERQELMQLIKSGLYDNQLRETIDMALEADEADRDLPGDRTTAILCRILAAEKNTTRLIPLRNTRLKARRLVIAASVAAAVAVLLAGWWLWAPSSAERRVGGDFNQPVLAATDTGGKQFITLPDGSTVYLNKGSRLSYPGAFENDSRVVELKGEAYFDIKPDEHRPFIVRTGNVNTTVLGTAFNIRAYDDQESVVVTVTKGKVKVGNEKRVYGIVTPNQQISVDLRLDNFKQEKVDAAAVVEWKKEYLVLDNISFEEAISLVSERYNSRIIIANEKLKQCRISATFLNREKLEQVLNVVCGVVSSTYTIKPDNRIVIEGGQCQ